jgi:hypothetical protein
MALNIPSSQKPVSAASILFLTLFSLKRTIEPETRKWYHKMDCLQVYEILLRCVTEYMCIVSIMFFYLFKVIVSRSLYVASIHHSKSK